mgnify:CR=1 FL=1|jgi:hypothetical protein|tara:strand:- start:484 stop:1461 length:978 start_codon:yes stop_codon:yes gene_type:complete
MGFSEITIDGNSCFLCGLEVGEITQEHVFPKWLQKRYNLWSKNLVLLNRTSIPYRTLTIPCCARCNNEDLADLETKISKAVSEGYEACSSLSDSHWYLWLGKLFYGILRKEIGLKADRSRSSSVPIISPKTLSSFSSLHLFLQGIRKLHQFGDRAPYSVLLCNLHDLGARRDFWFGDSFHYMTAGIRMGGIGVIVAFEDGSINAETIGQYLKKVNGAKLHPIQFSELYAKVSYQSYLLHSPIRYVSSKQDAKGSTTYTDVFGGYHLRPWSQHEFSGVLKRHVGPWLPNCGKDSVWFTEPDLVPTWMVGGEGEPLLQPLEVWEGAE